MDIVEESALKVDWEKNPSPHQGIEPVPAACWSVALPNKLQDLGLGHFHFHQHLGFRLG